MHLLRLCLLPGFVLLFLGDSLAQYQHKNLHPGHYLYLGKRPLAYAEDFLNHPAITGIQKKYCWRELEPERDRYDFSSITTDLRHLEPLNRHLVIQLGTKTFRPPDPEDPSSACVPAYLLEDPEFSGGVVPGKDGHEGWYPRRWDPAVNARIRALIEALGQAMNGEKFFEGINLEETALAADWDAAASDYDPQAYYEGLVLETLALADAFPDRLTVRYLNFFPRSGPVTVQERFRGIVETTLPFGMAFGGPDLRVHHPAYMANAYGIMHEYLGRILVAHAVQWGNYDWVNPETGSIQTADEIIAFSRDYLGASYLFWMPREPFFSRDVLPAIEADPHLAPVPEQTRSQDATN